MLQYQWSLQGGCEWFAAHMAPEDRDENGRSKSIPNMTLLIPVYMLGGVTTPPGAPFY